MECAICKRWTWAYRVVGYKTAYCLGCYHGWDADGKPDIPDSKE